MHNNFDEHNYDLIEHDKVRNVIENNDQFDSTVELEDALLEVQKMQDEASHVRDLKKRRNQFYDSFIKEKESKIDLLRDAIADCMNRNNKKKLNFPGIGSINSRKVKGKWEIINEDKLVEHLDSLGMSEEAGVQRVIKIDKTKLNKVLNKLKENNNVGDSAVQHEEKDSVSIKFDKSNVEEPAKENSDTKQEVKESSRSSTDDFDAIDI